MPINKKSLALLFPKEMIHPVVTMSCLFLPVQVVKALHYLQSELKVIHRDVKPSNILINEKGQVKICDFGISGYLVDSVAKTIDAGCKPYMAVSPCLSVNH